VPKICAADFGLLYESLLSEKRNEGPLWLLLDSTGLQENARGAFGFGSTKDGTEENFHLSTPGESVWFWRRLRRAQVSVSCDVRLGVTGASFALDPDVLIEREEFHCPAAEVLTDVPSRDISDHAVAIVAERCDDTSQPALRGNIERLYVSWPRAQYPWVRRLAAVLLEREDSDEIMEAYKYLARIVTRLQSRGYGEIARHHEIIEPVFHRRYGLRVVLA
jgi:hypothetical protein